MVNVFGEFDVKLERGEEPSRKRRAGQEMVRADGETSNKISRYSLSEHDEHRSDPLSISGWPGFRFHPTDDELVRCYLMEKIRDANSEFLAVGEVDFNLCEPWDLYKHAKTGQNLFYFFSLRELKYPTGSRTNRATASGYWKATGKDRQVMETNTGKLMGMKKTLVFYTGRAPKGLKTNWILHEYRVASDPEYSPSGQDSQWVICRVFLKNPSSSLRPGGLITSNNRVDNSPESWITRDAQRASSLGSLQSQSELSYLPPLESIEPPCPTSVGLAVPQGSLYGTLDDSLDNVNLVSLWDFPDLATPDIHQ